ncbi:GNAT family N-acetyltransferase [Streptomyces sp. NPDC093707]|uniref:GNAT family N-acetyltransferase n=1 Tax=Streptomyces sp. NPDC093707 TaxID=3154984 RepID=UPI00344DBBD7
MDASRYRIRLLQASDIDAALDLMAQANPSYDTQSLAANRRLLEIATAPAGTRPTEESLREMSRELVKLSGGALTADEVYRRLSEKAAAGEDLVAGALLTLVAEEIATGQVVGLVNAGPPAKWAHHALTQLPAPMVQQMRERVVEISEIAVSPGARRQGIGQELMNTLLNLDSQAAQSWRVAMWFFHENNGFGDFHRAMAPEWPVGRPIAFLDSARQVANFRELTGDLRACVAPLHQDLKLVVDATTGIPAIEGVFDQLWPETHAAPLPTPHSKPSKSERKREKKARGRARG